jgi:ABC-2 type transport system permease protein
MTGFKFVVGKSLIGFLLPLVQAYTMLWILNLPNINKLMILIIILASSFITVIFGFIMGVISSNQIAGIANMKIGFLVVSASMLGAILLPHDKHILLYWSPFYWSFIGLRGIITGTVTWKQVWTYTGWILGLTLLIFLSLRRRIEKGLA